MSSIRLRELIKQVRGCKTSAQERAVIARESAKIRTSFANNEVEYKPRNIAKLLYIHMLGYPTNFGDLEVISLCAAPEFTAKRVGYLGLMLLLDEDTQLLMMVTNSLRQDFAHTNQFVIGLSLSALANVGSASMCTDLAPEIERLLGSSNAYVRKKAALAAVRTVRKCPDLAERFASKIKGLLGEKNHGVLLTGLQLMLDLCEADHEYIRLFKKAVPGLVRILKALVISGYAPEYDVGGICDPFLQVKILRALRILGKRDPEASEAMNEILAQVTTNTEALRNVGNAILYEAVQTIMTIEANDGLRVLAINILGRFLSNRDNNIRYVALNTLYKVVQTNFGAVQRHRATIVDCLKDPDISIRRRALDLVYSLVNRKNIRPLVGELLGYLLVADEELRPDITSKLCMVTGRFAPSNQWHVDTILRVMSLAGQYIPEDVIGDTVALVSQNVEIQSYAVRRFYLALRKEPTKKPLVYVALWCIGEFADLLVQDDGTEYPDSSTGEGSYPLGPPPTEAEVVALLKSVIEHPVADARTCGYALTALSKVAARYGPTQQEAIAGILRKYQSSVQLESQTRACEFAALLSSGGDFLKTIMDRVPPLVLHGDDMAEDYDNEDSDSPRKVAPKLEVQQKTASLIDLDGLLGGGDNNSSNAPGSAGSAIDLLAGILPTSNHPMPLATSNSAPSGIDALLGVGGGTPPLVPAPGSASGGESGGGIDALLGLNGPSVPVNAPVAPATPPPITVYDKGGLKIGMQFAPQPDGSLVVQVVSINNGDEEFKGYSVLCAVPKYVKLNMATPSGTVLSPKGANQVTQQVKLENTEKPKPTLVKLKVEFSTASEGKKSQILDVANFPSHL